MPQKSVALITRQLNATPATHSFGTFLVGVNLDEEERTKLREDLFKKFKKMNPTVAVSMHQSGLIIVINVPSRLVESSGLTVISRTLGGLLVKQGIVSEFVCCGHVNKRIVTAH